MKRILIIGCGGAGKSTLAYQLKQILHLEIIHLDYYFWQPGWKASLPEDWETQVRQLITGNSWIMDGNYSGTLDLRAGHADTIIFLDLSRWKCLWGILRRRIQFHGQTRPGLPSDCPEKIDGEFFWYVWNYRRTRRPKLLEKLNRYRTKGKRVYIFENRQQIRCWLNTLVKE